MAPAARADHHIVNGSRRYITHAPQASVFTLMAGTNPADKGAGGVSAFIVDADLTLVESMSINPYLTKR